MFHVPNQHRANIPGLPSWVVNTDDLGNNGLFLIKTKEGTIAYIIASDGMGWDHVSIHMVELTGDRTPTWEEMCTIKEMFWDEEDCVVQYHPPKSQYVNCHPHTLHLWKPNRDDVKIPMPLSILVGPMGGMF